MTKRVLLGIFICTLLISCKTKMEETNQNVHRKWMLVQFEDFQKEELIEKKCFLNLTNKDYATANMGCNDLGFEYFLKEDNSMTISKMLTTYVHCENNKIESKFISAINNIENFKINGHKLYLKTKSNQELVFVAEDWD